MQVECIRPFGLHDVGDVAEVPDGAVFDESHWRAAGAPETPPESSSPAVPAVIPVTASPQEM